MLSEILISKATILFLVSILERFLSPLTNRCRSLSPQCQVLCTLRYFASGAHMRLIGDSMGLSQPTVSRVVLRVAKAIATLARQYIKFPSEDELATVKQQFYKIAADMNHQVPEFYWAVSERLSNILDNVGYSHEDRDRKVRVAIEADVFWNMTEALNKSGFNIYLFGSRGEGSTGPGLQSDIDCLIQLNDRKVVTDLTDCQPDKYNLHMVKDNITHPGYVKLQSIYISPDYTPIPIYHEESIDKDITIDSLNRSVLLNTVHHEGGIVSGPAWHKCSTDYVHALRCSQWPREGYEWFQHRRFYGWPKPTQIENAWEYGCFATPVGHPHSSEKHLEWRLSFSIAERNLTRSFEDTVMKVYILLKMIKKTYIEPAVGDAFSSYFCKVCMLWMRERTPRELWSNENLLHCLILCIRQLYEWATAGFCPDYFIVTNNIYDRKIVGAKQFYLVQILRSLLSTDCRFLLDIKCCYLGQLLANGISGFDLHHIWNIPHICKLVVWEEVLFLYFFSIGHISYCRYSILKHIPQYYPTLVDYLQRLMYAYKHLPYIMQYPLKHVMRIVCSQLGFYIATVCKKNACFLSPEKVEYLVALALRCLSLGINSDATSVRLKLCGLGIELGNYNLTEACLQHIIDYRMRYMYSLTVDLKDYVTVLKCNLESHVEKHLTKRYSTEELVHTHVSCSVVYMPLEILITPKPLTMEMFRSVGASPEGLRDKLIHSWYEWGVVDSLMCLYFFQYLNFSRQGKERHKEVAMDNMIHVIRTEPDILHRETALNLLGYTFMQESQFTNAFICFTQSLKIRPYHNAAKFYLGLLFKRVHVTHRRRVHYGSRTNNIAS